MKRFPKLTALFLAVMMLVSVFSVGVFAENDPVTEPDTSTVTEDPATSEPGTSEPSEGYTVQIEASGSGVGTFTCYFNGVAASDAYAGTIASLPVQVVPAEGYKISAAVFGPKDEGTNLTSSADGSYSGTFDTVAGTTYILFVVTEPTSAVVKNTLVVDSNIAFTVKDQNGLDISDVSTYEFAEGDIITVIFSVDGEFGEFDPAKASLTINGKSVSLSTTQTMFVAVAGENTVTMNYDLSAPKVPATFDFSGTAVPFTLYKDGVAVDSSSVMVGDSVTITFDAADPFIPANAALTINGTAVAMTSPSHTFTAAESNVITYTYEAKVATVNVTTDGVAYTIYGDDGNEVSTFLTGDRITIRFEDSFLPEDVRLYHNGKKKSLDNYAYTFVITELTNNIQLGLPTTKTITISAYGKDFSNVDYSVVVDGNTINPVDYKYEVGSEVKIVFNVKDFLAEDAFLTVNNNLVSLSDNTYTFTVAEDDVIVFGYGVVPVRVTIDGLGAVKILDTAGNEITSLTNSNASRPSSVNLFLNKGQEYVAVPSASFSYEMSGEPVGTEITVSKTEDGKYSFTAPSAHSSTAKISVKYTKVVSSEPTFTVNVGISSGVGSVNLVAGSGANVTVTANHSATVAQGDNVTFTLTPGEGYILDKVLVNGVKIEVADNTFALSNIQADQSVSIVFKLDKEFSSEEIIDVDDIDWDASKIVVIGADSDHPIAREVFDKIAQLSGDGYVEFAFNAASIYIPYGRSINDISDTVTLNVIDISSDPWIRNVVDAQFVSGTRYKAFKVEHSEQLPLGSKIMFNLGGDFANSSMTLFDDNLNAISDAQYSNPSGFSAEYAYGNHGTLICVKDAMFEDETDTSDVPDTSDTNSDPVDSEPDIAPAVTSDSSDSDSNSGSGVVIVIVIIALVAVAGAATLFIVKWRQEKF